MHLHLSRPARPIASGIATYEVRAPAHFSEVDSKSKRELDDQDLLAVNPAGLEGLPHRHANRSREMSTILKSMLANLLLAASAVLAPALASAANDSADVAPPVSRVEPVVPREGYIWAPGYWEWSGRAYRWVSGTYIYERRGAHWVADRWEQVGPHWQHVHGHWEQGQHETLAKE
jgi:WXXGXW repeat (2 copies)